MNHSLCRHDNTREYLEIQRERPRILEFFMCIVIVVVLGGFVFGTSLFECSFEISDQCKKMVIVSHYIFALMALSLGFFQRWIGDLIQKKIRQE